MSKKKIDNLEDLDFGVRKVGFFAWRAEFWTKTGEPLWFGRVWRFRKQQAVTDMATMVDILVNGATEEAE